jgi:transposase InsO family protein
VIHARDAHGMSERRACRVVKQPRGTQRYRPTQRDDEDTLTQAIVTLASQYGRYGYRRITALLRRAGWHVGKDRVERIWRREGLKVPKKQKPRGRLWLNDGSCVRLRPQHANHVWSYDFVSAKTHDGRTVRMLNLIDEHTRESLLVRPERRWSSAKVIEYLADVMVVKGVPEHIRSDNGPEFVRERSAEVARGHWGKDTLHRARVSMGERLLRIVQLEAAGRVPERRDLLLVEGGADTGRTLAGSLQHHQATLFARL